MFLLNRQAHLLLILVVLVAFALFNVVMFYLNVQIKNRLSMSSHRLPVTVERRKTYRIASKEHSTHAQTDVDGTIRLSRNSLNISQYPDKILDLSNQIEQLQKLMVEFLHDRKTSSNRNEILPAQLLKSGQSEDKQPQYDTGNIRSNQRQKPKAFLTLFTSWSENPDMYEIHNNTVKNWASFRPIINPVLYTDGLESTSFLKSFGWEVRKVPKSAENGLPILKYMYMDAINAYESDFFGFVNGDILFTTDIIETLLSVRYAYDIHDDSKPLFITGQRWDVVNVSQSDIFPRNNLSKIASSRGTLFHAWAEDYFITSRSYPWDDIPEVIISSLGHDNWLVMNARNQRHIVIDSSQTIIVVHQSLAGNTYVSHDRKQANYNTDLLQRLSNVKIAYERGQTNCIERYTTRDGESVVVRRRATLAQFCY